MLVKPSNNLKAQSITFVQAKTNEMRLISPSNFLFKSIIAGSNTVLVPTNFPDGTWGLIVNAASSGGGGGNFLLLTPNTGSRLLLTP